MKKIIVSSIYLLMLFAAYSSNQETIDSLKVELANEKHHDTTYFKLIYEIGVSEPIYRINYWDSLGKMIESTLENETVSEETEEKLNDLLASVQNNIGFLHLSTGDNTTAIEYFEKSLHTFEKLDNKYGMADAYINIGYINETEGKIPLAINYFHEALKLQESLNDTAGAAQSHNNIGANYFKQGDDNLGLEHLYEALKLREQINDLPGISESYINIGAILKHQGELAKTLSYYQKALEIRESLKDQEGIADTYNNIGCVLHEMNRLDESEKYFEEAIEIQKKLNDKSSLAFSYSNLGGVYFDLGDIDMAKTNVKEGLKIAQDIGYPEIISHGARLLFKIEKREGHYENALKMYELHIQMRDSLKNEETQKATIRQQTKYEFEKAQLIKEQQETEIVRKEKEATDRRNSLQYSIILVAIVAVFGLILTLGFVSVTPKFAEGLIFFAFLILFEFLLILSDPYLDSITGGAPAYKLLANAIIAATIFPAHAFFERVLKKKLIEKR